MATYDKLQADLQSIRDEIQAFLKSQAKVEEAQVFNSEEDIVRAQGSGGVNNLFDLSKHTKGVIGLGQASIITDYPRPFINPLEYKSIELSQEEIDKCRKACRSGNLKEVAEGNNPNLGDDMMDTGERTCGEYFVEYPSKGDDDIDCTNSKLHDEDERKLVCAMSTALVLKRPRECRLGVDSGEDMRIDDTSPKRYKKEAQLLLMAEAAGLPLPPTSP